MCQAPGIPCALIFEDATIGKTSGAIAPREGFRANGNVWGRGQLLPLNRVEMHMDASFATGQVYGSASGAGQP